MSMGWPADLTWYVLFRDWGSFVGGIAATLAAIAAMAAAVGTFRTVRQMKTQMEASYRPEIAIPRVRVKGEAESSAFPLPLNWNTPPLETPSGTVISYPIGPHSMRFILQLHNIGLGAATGVKVDWCFPVVDMVDKVNTLAQRALVPVFFEFKNDILSFHSDIWPTKLMCNWIGNARSEYIDYITPANESLYYSGGATLPIPMPFILLSSSYLYFSMSLKEEDRVYDFDIPPLRALITYHDISGQSRQTCFDISLHTSLVTTEPSQGIAPQSQKMIKFEGYIEARKIDSVTVHHAQQFFVGTVAAMKYLMNRL